MFKRRLKIKSIAVTSTGEFLFTMGLGSDGNCYMWNSQSCQWMLHKSVTPQEQK